MSREELEGDLNTIFSRLRKRNTEPFWVQPRNNLTCMTQNYDPATWFLTLSPRKWDWGDLHQYLRDVNAPAMQGKPVSELIALDLRTTDTNDKWRITLDANERTNSIEHVMKNNKVMFIYLQILVFIYWL